MDSVAGRLLIAGPDLFDPNFRRTIVLVGHHDEEGALGVVLNRALEVTVGEAVPVLSTIADPDEPVFSGGPVQPTSVVVVADFHEPHRAGVLAFDSIGFLPDEPDDDLTASIRRARVFAGYAGWGPGQLEQELLDDSWIVTRPLADDVFHPGPGRLWNDVLQRMGSKYDFLRLMPADPSLN
jgi:putative transcriptional regulator